MNLFCYICIALNTFVNPLINKTATEINDNTLLGVCLKHVDVGSTLFKNMKTCTKCKIPKEESDFGNQKLGKNGLMSKCKVCATKYVKDYYKNNKKERPTITLPIVDGEIWKDVIGYEGIYKVSSLGNVKALCVEKYRGKYKQKQPEKLLKSKKHRDGYLCVTLCHSKNSKTFQAHRLVAIMFIPNPENKPCVNHKNGIKNDNRLENLEWATVSENTKHSFDNGLQIKAKGEDCSYSKLTNEQVIDIYTSTKSRKEISDIYAVDPRYVSSIRTGRRWKHLTSKLIKPNR